MILLLQNLVSGIAAGAVYAVLAIGIVLVYRSSSVVNFAHGSFAMLSTYVAFELVRRGFAPWIAVSLAMLCAFLLGGSTYVGLVRPAAQTRGGHNTIIIVTLGLYLLIEGLAAAIWGTDTKAFPIGEGTTMLHLGVGGVVLAGHDLLVIAVSIVVALALAWFFRSTISGLSLRAIRDDELGARLIGLNVERAHALVWGASGVLAAVAGLLLVPRLLLEPSMMFVPTLKAFAVAVVGGMGSLSGAVATGLALGVLETLIGAYVSTELQSMFAFVVLMVVIAVRPEGLVRQRGVTRA